jgi:hypothetical protein
MLGLATIVVFDQLLRRAGRPELTALPDVAPGELASLVAATVGALVATRRPHHPVGWLLLAFGLVGFLSDAGHEYAHYALRPSNSPQWPHAMRPSDRDRKAADPIGKSSRRRCLIGWQGEQLLWVTELASGVWAPRLQP